MGRLFEELKRRNVFRVAVAYVVSGWLVLQVVDVVLGNIDAPSWVFSVFLLAGIVFFVPVIVFAWAYELTPEGLKRESEVDRTQSITRQTGHKLDKITIGMLIAVVGFVLLERLMFPAETAPETVAADAEATTELAAEATTEVNATSVDDKSIAVLAFDDLSPGGDQGFFAEGLSEEILNVLAQVPGLKVAGRTSSFAFKGKGADLREIGEVLNVAHILEGSVRKAGDRIRVTAQLIQTSDGFHLFSRTYDRDLNDVFAVQDDLAALIGEALRAELAGDAIPAVAQTSVEAYDFYLLARQRLRTRHPELLREAGEFLDQAIAVDPDYAPAFAQRALVWTLLSDDQGSYGDIPAAVAIEQGLASVERALELDPLLAEAHAIYGLIVGDLPGRRDEGIASLRRALELNPNIDDGKVWLGRISGSFEEAVALNEQVVSRDPLFGPAFNNLIGLYNRNADFDRSEALIDRVTRISGSAANVQLARGEVALLRGDLSAAVRYLEDALSANPNDTVSKVNLGFALLGLGEFERAASEGMPDQAIIAYWQLGDFETTDSLIRGTDFRAGSTYRQIEFAADYLAARGRAAEVIQIVNDHYGSMETLLEELPFGDTGYGTAYLGPLAYACLQAGADPEFQAVVSEMGATLDRYAASGSDSWIFWLSRAQYATLTGDSEAAVAHLEAALNRGYADVAPPQRLFAMIADDPRYRAFEAAALTRANRERLKLGLEPYEAPLRFE